MTSLLPFSVFRQNFSDFSVSKRSLFYFPKKKKKSHPFAFKEEEALIRQSTKRHKKSMSSSATAYNTLGARTRAQKGRMGERDLWDVIVNNDDICFKHILPSLNRTDIKFLYEMNSETRKLIKRSSRAGDLKKRFKVEEMSSISTLEVAWEHYPWGTYDHEVEAEMDETLFCWKVARTNKLELLKWIREEKKCEWDEETISIAARRGNLEMVKYCVANQCPVSEEVCTDAASNGRLKVLKYLHEEAKAPWDSEAIAEAYFNCKHDCLQYLLDNDCPLLDGWWYDGVHLHTF